MEQVELEDRIGVLMHRLHDNLFDCKSYHVMDNAFSDMSNGVQTFYEALRDGEGQENKLELQQRLAAFHFLIAACNHVAAASLECAASMIDQPLDGDDVPDLGNAFTVVWGAVLNEIARILSVMTHGGIIIDNATISADILPEAGRLN